MKFNVTKEDYFRSGIYKITTGSKVYIGQTTNFNNRYRCHVNGGHGKKVQIDEDSTFEIIEIVKDPSEMDERECYWIDYYDSYNNGMNSKAGMKRIEIGSKGFIQIDTLSIKVLIIDKRTSFGRVDVLITPIAGSGEKWIDLNSLQAE